MRGQPRIVKIKGRGPLIWKPLCLNAETVLPPKHSLLGRQQLQVTF